MAATQEEAHVSEVADRPLLSVAEVAEWLSVSEKTIRRLVAKGELTVAYVGGQLRFEQSAVRRYIDKGNRKGE